MTKHIISPNRDVTVIVGKNAGFCMGVRRAVEMVMAAIGKDKKIATFGPLIHNPQVLNVLHQKNVVQFDKIPAKGEGIIYIRAHGVPPDTKAKLDAVGFQVADATCPRVIKVQTIIRKHADQGAHIIIVGDNDHPEVVGLLGFSRGRGIVVDNCEQLRSLPSFDQAIVVAQTTQNKDFYDQIKEELAQRHPNYQIFDTICDSTEKRQAEVRRLAEMVDRVLVVGGLKSGNTKRLAEIASTTGKPVFHIETEDQVTTDIIQNSLSIGITAGASTPDWVIENVRRAVLALR